MMVSLTCSNCDPLFPFKFYASKKFNHAIHKDCCMQIPLAIELSRFVLNKCLLIFYNHQLIWRQTCQPGRKKRYRRLMTILANVKYLWVQVKHFGLSNKKKKKQRRLMTILANIKHSWVQVKHFGLSNKNKKKEDNTCKYQTF